MTSDAEVAYWDAEALEDPRYARANWGMGSSDDGQRTIKAITDIIEAQFQHRMVRVLEIGCGPCRLLLRLAELWPDADFYGTDISPEMLWIANRRIGSSKASNIHVDTVKPHLGMDVVYCVELMQHLDDEPAQRVIADAWAALRPGGVFVAQFVTRGEPGPHSFPRDEDGIRYLFNGVGSWWFNRVNIVAVHPDWLFVFAVKR